MVRRRREPGPELEKSRSQKKRDSTALQAMGEELVGLAESSLASLPLSEDLREALRQIRAIRSHEARRRHMQYIGRLMREIDTEPVRVLLDSMRDTGQRDSARFQRIEAWRDRLVAGDESAEAEVVEIMQAFPHAEGRQIRQLAKLAREEAAAGRPPHASRRLFRYLRGLDEATTQPDPAIDQAADPENDQA